ncbi:hypothetical protein OHS33_00695 [Streptomyces sp. NBC_00536]|nr:hypothetical protein [Streptomyces sp. NBC_00536]WUC76992.1 hypothetical protein OHS33_00695 [Streptomyces sp. NBC_00536]
MEAPTVQAPLGDTRITNEEFDLVIGELEQDAPESTRDIGSCHRVYCML